jgi:hypothetical protein
MEPTLTRPAEANAEPLIVNSTSPTLPTHTLERLFLGGAGPKTRVKSTSANRKSRVV